MIPLENRVATNTLQGETVESTIAITPTAFRILFDSIYEDKVLAIVREIWSNAYDSHRRKGCGDRPFESHLPTQLEPFFSVRDFGVSMTHDFLMNHFTRIFESDKREGNDEVGMFGLGSKSPLAYTDGFTINAYSDGQCRTYIYAFGEEGIPAMTYLSTRATTADDGLEVSFPVKYEDIEEFALKAVKVGLGFEVLPVMTGAKVDFNTWEVFLHGDGWKIIEGQLTSVRQGCVLYPVDRNSLPDLGLEWRYGLVVDVPNGTLDVAASRETLSLTTDTRAKLRTIFTDAVEKAIASVSVGLENAPNSLEAEILAHGFRSVFSDKKLKATPLSYKGRPLTGRLHIPLTAECSSIASDWINHKEEYLVAERKNYIFIVDRGQKFVRRKLRYKAFKESQGNYRAVIYVLDQPTSKDLATLQRRLGLEQHQIIGIEALPDVAKVLANGKKVVRTGVYKPDYWRIHKQDEDPEDDADFYWMPFAKAYRTTPVVFDQFKNTHDIAFQMDAGSWCNLQAELFTYLDIPFRKFLLLTPAAVERLSDDVALKENNLQNVVASHLKKNRTVIEQCINREARLLIFGTKERDLFPSILDKFKGDDVWYPRVSGTGRAWGNKLGWDLLTRYFSTEIEAARVAAQEERAKLIEEYPMIFNAENVQAMKDYIKLINDNKGQATP